MYEVLRYHTSDSRPHLMGTYDKYSAAVKAMKDGATSDLVAGRGETTYRRYERNRIEVVLPRKDHSIVYGVSWYIEKKDDRPEFPYGEFPNRAEVCTMSEPPSVWPDDSEPDYTPYPY